MKKASSRSQQAFCAAPPEIVSINQSALQRAQRMLALCDRRLDKLEQDSKAADALPLRDMQHLARMIHNLEKDVQAYAAIVYPTPQESAQEGITLGDAPSLDSLLTQTVEAFEKMEASTKSSAPVIDNALPAA